VFGHQLAGRVKQQRAAVECSAAALDRAHDEIDAILARDLTPQWK
jgi:hypothetical protein